MFYVKNDDMEDMFKKAADKYELNEEMAADWHTVHAALQNDREVGAIDKKRKEAQILFVMVAFINSRNSILYL